MCYGDLTNTNILLLKIENKIKDKSKAIPLSFNCDNIKKNNNNKIGSVTLTPFYLVNTVHDKACYYAKKDLHEFINFMKKELFEHYLLKHFIEEHYGKKLIISVRSCFSLKTITLPENLHNFNIKVIFKKFEYFEILFIRDIPKKGSLKNFVNDLKKAIIEVIKILWKLDETAEKELVIEFIKNFYEFNESFLLEFYNNPQKENPKAFFIKKKIYDFFQKENIKNFFIKNNNVYVMYKFNEKSDFVSTRMFDTYTYTFDKMFEIIEKYKKHLKNVRHEIIHVTSKSDEHYLGNVDYNTIDNSYPLSENLLEFILKETKD